MASDLKKVDAYVNGPADYEEMPELGDDFFARAEPKIGGKPIQLDRKLSVSDGVDLQVTFRLDPGVIDGFRATGPGWESRINEVLRAWLAQRAA